jgi:TonB family protein
MRVGNGVTAPRLLRKVEPKYSDAARNDRIQGTVILELVVNEKGRPTDISIISPLGFGLDELAIAAVEQWEFAPGRMGDRAVKILASVEVHFRFPELRFDEKAERQRTSFNVALQNLNRSSTVGKTVEHSVETMQNLARQKYPAAMYLVGLWKIKGTFVAQDEEGGLDLIQKAAAKNCGPALYEVGIRRFEGRELAKDEALGLEQLRSAVVLGSPQAQFYLANRYEKGIGVPQEPDRARRYFRLCATQGVALCQYRLGSMLMEAPERRERDYVQAVALFQLAADQGLAPAKEAASRETPNLTQAQVSWVKTLKEQLVRK